jgi:putative transposase
MNELKNRGVQDILVVVIDGLKGFPEAITAVSPKKEESSGYMEVGSH